MYYILHGDDEFSRDEELARLRSRLAAGDAAMAELNTSILDGGTVTLGELRHVCDAIPFLADRRMVIVRGLLSRLISKRKTDGQEKSVDEEPAWRREYVGGLLDYLTKLPATTRLLFVENEELRTSHPVLKFSQSEAGAKTAHIRLFKRRKDRELPGWIEARARAKGGSISRQAAEQLGMLASNDMRLLDQEIEKLLSYADGRQVTAEDVRLLVSRARETSIFDLVDCIGQRRIDCALRLLHQMLDQGEEPLYLLVMIARQVRILIQVMELQAQGNSAPEIARRLELHEYVVEKGLIQARNFTPAELRAAHERVVETDLAIKTGQVEEIVALDLLVESLAASVGQRLRS